MYICNVEILRIIPFQCVYFKYGIQFWGAHPIIRFSLIWWAMQHH